MPLKHANDSDVPCATAGAGFLTIRGSQGTPHASLGSNGKIKFP